MTEAYATIRNDRAIMKIGVIQGLTEGCLFVFVYLWSPLLAKFAARIPADGSAATFGLDDDRAPAYGLIFGGFMACGALGGYLEPAVRNGLARTLRRPPALSLSSASSAASDLSEDDHLSKATGTTATAPPPDAVVLGDPAVSSSDAPDAPPPLVELLASQCHKSNINQMKVLKEVSNES